MQTLHIVIQEPLPTALLRPFQKGAQVEVEVGGDLLSLLTDELSLTEEGISKIQTIFYQSKPVDDISTCTVQDGGVLALSAAMPGLVGAVLRRGGFWSAMRDSITHQDETIEQTTTRGVITVKLFNFMLEEVGPILLERGIRIEVADLAALLTEKTVAQRLVKASLAETEVRIGQLGGLLGGEQTVLLQVSTLQESETE